MIKKIYHICHSSSDRTTITYKLGSLDLIFKASSAFHRPLSVSQTDGFEISLKNKTVRCLNQMKYCLNREDFCTAVQLLVKKRYAIGECDKIQDFLYGSSIR